LLSITMAAAVGQKSRGKPGLLGWDQSLAQLVSSAPHRRHSRPRKELNAIED
jgi:hypothetical protein